MVSIIVTNLLLTLVISIVIYCIYIRIHKYLNTISVKSNIDNNYYIVRNTSKKQESADTFALLNIRIEKLFTELKKQPDHSKFSKNISLLLNRYNKHALMENVDFDNTSYTINKGQEINMCVMTRNSEENIYDIDTLYYVIAHEISHIGCESIGHTHEFTDFFRFILQKSIDIGVYKYRDYSKDPVNYCGLELNMNVLN
jgi:hypothetical protein